MKKHIRILYFIISILSFIFLAISIGSNGTTSFENWIYEESIEYMNPVFTSCIKLITYMGDSYFVIFICLLLFALPITRKDYAIPISCSVIISSVLNLILKHIFLRERPDILNLIIETSYSFPSGHAMVNSSLYATLAFLACRFIENKKIKNSFIILSIIMTTLIGFSRIYLGVHYATDILGGWILGILIAFAVVKITIKKNIRRI